MVQEHNRKPEKETVTLTVSLNPSKMKENCAYGEEMSVEEKKILSQLLPEEPCLPYPLRLLPMQSGRPALEYQIPDEDRQEIFNHLYPFTDNPSLDERRMDIHANKEFCIRDFKVIRENNRNMMVSPYYATRGGTVIDWLKVGEQMSVQVFRNDGDGKTDDDEDEQQ